MTGERSSSALQMLFPDGKKKENYFALSWVNMQIKNIDQIIDIVKDWKPSAIAFIKSIVWKSGNLTLSVLSQQRENIKEWPDFDGEFYQISLTFESVSNLKLEFAGKGMHRVSGFDVIDISGNGWEGVNFQVEDYEDGSVGFYCKDIVVEGTPEIVFMIGD